MPCRHREQRCASDHDVVPLFLESAAGGSLPQLLTPLVRGFVQPAPLCVFDVGTVLPHARDVNDFLRRAARTRRYSRNDFELALPHMPVPAALLMPAPLQRFLAQVGPADMLHAIESILWDAAPAQFPVPRHPNRFSYALDEVLLALTDTHDAPGEFWRIPIHALPVISAHGTPNVNAPLQPTAGNTAASATPSHETTYAVQAVNHDHGQAHA